jgi:hypothetical protein
MAEGLSMVDKRADSMRRLKSKYRKKHVALDESFRKTMHQRLHMKKVEKKKKEETKQKPAGQKNIIEYL